MQKTTILFFILLYTFQGYSQQNLDTEAIVTDRPDLTESSRTVPHKSIQIETGFLMFIEQPSISSEFPVTIYQFPTTLVRVGFYKNVELRVFNQLVNERTNNPSTPLNERSTYGVDNLQLGTKINLTTEKGLRPEIAVLSHVVLPLGTDEFKNAKTLFNLVLSLSHSLSDKLSLGYNLGWTTDDINPKGTGTYTLAFGYPISSKLGFYLEGYGALKNMETATLGIDGGFTYLLNNNIQLDASAGKSLTAENYFFSAGFSWLIPGVF